MCLISSTKYNSSALVWGVLVPYHGSYWAKSIFHKKLMEWFIDGPYLKGKQSGASVCPLVVPQNWLTALQEPLMVVCQNWLKPRQEPLMNPKWIYEYLSNIQQQTNFSLKMHSLQNASSGRNAVVHIQGHCVALVLQQKKKKTLVEHGHQACALCTNSQGGEGSC